MSKRISPTLNLDDKAGRQFICCASCGAGLVEFGGETHWKDKVPVKVAAVAGLHGWSKSVQPDLQLREFSCPECGHLLDSETGLPEDPYLYDVVNP
ncbi:acetone carboxylase subunit gamma [Neopusillimonas maritima]|jgi:acetone carboxylase gamma subunit|uniref:Acetone carboxylase subunit gamma n=1 Tax=Neopusillimonas maritima TaxID=2026239 RepID=A0ABX9MSY4_9BURK|nr:acetone carboxylase subunit gamma [Neopusillimonas maritima]RII81666.1 hypothetical protein CJO09_15280 [Neopusillimonas maritima]THF93245.1 MAG: hypothetical protein E8G75_04150 [Sulfitobacter sp. SK025]